VKVCWWTGWQRKNKILPELLFYFGAEEEKRTMGCHFWLGMSSNIFLWFCHTAGRQFTRNWQSHYNSINSSTLPRKAVVICYFALRFFFFLRLGSYFHDNFRPVASSCPPSAAFCRVLMDFRPVVGCCCFFFLFRYLTTMLLARVYSLNSYIAIQSIDLVGIQCCVPVYTWSLVFE
jgi:hypothetical protein